MTGREFFTTRTVGEALTGFAPSRRTAEQRVTLANALRRVPVQDVVAPGPLPGFARSTVDGYAVQAADTYGASEGLPSYLDVTGAVQMGTEPDVTVAATTAMEIPTGGALPVGADAVVMVEYTNETMPAVVEVLRAVAPGAGVVRADEDVAAGAVLVPAGRPLRAGDLGMLAAAGVTEVVVHAQPRVAILSTGDEVVAPDTVTLRPGQVRDAIASALAGLVIDAGGVPVLCGIVPDDPAALRGALRAALGQADLVVISAGSSVGARDATADAVASLGRPGIFCHGLAVKPGKPTLLAECDGVPVIGLPGNPLSALVVFRLVGIPLTWRLAGCDAPPPEPSVTASLTRQVPSEAGRRDIVQVQFNDGQAEPLFGASALLSVLTRADGYLIVPEPATGLDAGAQVSVTLYR